jgi:hypothetical protein
MSGITRALLIGITYTGDDRLHSEDSAGDLELSQAWLKHIGFTQKRNNFRLLSEASGNKRRPTKAEILSGLRWLTRDTADGDVLFLHFSGAGSSVDSKTTGLTEALSPVDYKKTGLLMDFELNKYLCAVAEGVTLYTVFDCCHNGSILDLQHVYDERDAGWLQAHEGDGDREPLGCIYSLASVVNQPVNVDDDLMRGELSAALYPLLRMQLSWSELLHRLRMKLSSSSTSNSSSSSSAAAAAFLYSSPPRTACYSYRRRILGALPGRARASPQRGCARPPGATR